MGLQSLVANNRDTITNDDGGNPSQRVIIGNQPIEVDATVETGGATTPVITNLNIPVINTEVSHVLQDNLNELVIRSRDIAKVQISFVSTESGTKFVTINPGAVLCLNGLDFDTKTLYVQSDTVTTLEILEIHS